MKDKWVSVFFITCLVGVAFLAVLVALEIGAPAPEPRTIDLKAWSWDQENLKRYDRGCPTAVFIAPQGELEQCP